MAYKCKEGHFTDKEHEGENCPYDSKNDLENLKNKVSSKNKKETYKDKIPSVKIELNKDSILPELSQSALKKMDIKENKKVILKSSIIQRNLERHPDISLKTMGEIVQNALYDYDEILPGKNKEEKYFSFIKVMRVSSKDGKPVYGVVLLDVNVNNEKFEIVHCHWVKEKNIKSLK